MTSINNLRSLASLILVACLLAVPVNAWGKKGRDHYNRGMSYEKAQQWEKAAQEFTLAVAADPSNVEYQLHYRRAIFNASQTFMQQGRALAEQRDYVGAYNAFRQAFGYDPVNQLAVSEMERMLRLQAVKEGTALPGTNGDGTKPDEDNQGTPSTPSASRPSETLPPPRQEQVRVINYSGDLKSFIRTLAEQLNLNVVFDRQSFAQPRTLDINLHEVTTAKALDYIFLQEGLFFQKLDRRTIMVADQARRPQYQQLVMRTFYLANMKPTDAANFIQKAIPASVGRPNMVVVTEEGTNSITVRDTAENVRLIGDLLNSIDKDRAEVVMDVSIYEVNRSSLLQIGNQMGSGAFNLGGSPGFSILTGQGVTNNTSSGVNLSSIVGAVPTGWAAALVLPQSTLNAFQSKNNGRLIASTQVHAFNGEESTARIGQRVPVQTAQVYGYQPTTGTGTGVNSGVLGTNGYPVINYEPTGLTLKFTPTVFPNLDVQVKMNIEAKDVTGANTLTPTFTERAITGTARVQNNRTMLLASVSQEIQSNGRQGFPVLSGLPILGRLFSAPTRDDRQIDIVIAVTPRVLRAPAVTPRDEETRPSGTTMTPTTGSLEAMLRETVREEQIIAARQIPKDAVIQLPDAAPTYVPAPSALVANQNTQTENTANAATATRQPAIATPASFTQPKGTESTQDKGAVATVETRPAVTNGKVAASEGDASMPAPKSAVQTATEAPAPRTIDVASAIKSIVSPNAGASTVADTKEETKVQPTAEQLAPKSDAGAKLSNGARNAFAGIKLVPGKGEMRVGEKQLVAVDFKSDAPIAMAALTLRFDPRVIKVNKILPGVIFAGAKTAPIITQSTDQHGMLLVSIFPANGPIQVNGESSLLNLEIEAIGTGNGAMALAEPGVHLVASDRRNVIPQVESRGLVVKQ